MTSKIKPHTNDTLRKAAKITLNSVIVSNPFMFPFAKPFDSSRASVRVRYAISTIMPLLTLDYVAWYLYSIVFVGFLERNCIVLFLWLKVLRCFVFLGVCVRGLIGLWAVL